MLKYRKEQPETIQSMFANIASRYDRTNTVLSFGMHKLWNRELVHRVLVPCGSGPFLDLCCGTGEIAFTYLKDVDYPCQGYMLDFCQEMLQAAKDKAKRLGLTPKHTLKYLQADAQEIPLFHESVACVTVAYGIRNVQDPMKCFKEVWRVLQPGGLFGILELTRPESPFLRAAHQIYLNTCIPVLGRLVTANPEAYRYLSNSVRTFVHPAQLQDSLQKIGFQTSKPILLNGGMATILIAKKRD